MLELISESESELELLISVISELISESRYFEPVCWSQTSEIQKISLKSDAELLS